MTDEATQATAENLRADFLNATTTAARWKVLNAAIDWAVAASENADHYRQKAQAKEHTVNIRVDSGALAERVARMASPFASGGVVQGHGGLIGERAGEAVVSDAERARAERIAAAHEPYE
jgi:hypothetical protein